MPRRSTQNHNWVYILWGVNGMVVLCLLAFGVFYLNGQRASAAEAPVNLTDPAPTRKLHPTSYWLPTLTPNPFYTPPVFETSTPFVLVNGPPANIIGFSLAGRPIEAYSFGSGEREYLIVAGIHGGSEWNTIALANELITYINEHPDIIAGDTTLYIIRNMNPDGEARAHGVDGRVNNNGVDLNRNFPTNWAADWDRDGCWDYTTVSGGTGPASEPETKALVAFLQTHKIEALISYHSAALGVFPGGEPWEKDSIKFAKALAEVTDYKFPPLDTGCVFTGTLADYAVERGAVAVDMELSTHVYTDFKRNLKALKVLLDWER